MRNDEFTLRNGIPLLPLNKTQPITMKMVKRIEAEEYLRESKTASERAREQLDSPGERR